VVPIDQGHDRSTFNSGSEPLDHYFGERVTQDIRCRATACFVALSRDGSVAGYCTLASASVCLGDLPTKLIKKLPRFPSVPAAQMGRPAVDQTFKGQEPGGALSADALTRVVRSGIAGCAPVVDVKDKTAADFYRHHGSPETTSEPLTLFPPLTAVPVPA
jgi:hypothetical protein